MVKNMLIRVMYGNKKYDMVKPFLLDRLIRSGRLQMFLRSEGWVVIDRDPVQKRDESYQGSDRRKSLTHLEYDIAS
jgi:hypothetical protein